MFFHHDISKGNGMRIRIKMCGITSVEEAQAAIAFGADALGFVFFEASHRNVAVKTVSEIVSSLPAFVDSVGVFANEKAENVIKNVVDCKLNHLQFHGDESVDYCLQFARTFPGMKIIKAFKIEERIDLNLIQSYEEAVDGFLFDIPAGWQPGEIAGQLDLDGLAQISISKPLILSGSLNIDNVDVVVKQVRPFAVDLNSGMELLLGEKIPAELQKLIEKVRFMEV